VSTFTITKNDKATKTVKAKYIDSIWTQFNGYAKKKGAVSQNKKGAIGCMVWVLPTGEILELKQNG